MASLRLRLGAAAWVSCALSLSCGLWSSCAPARYGASGLLRDDARAEPASAPPIQAEPAYAATARDALPASVRVRLEGLERKAVLEVLRADGAPLTLRRDGAEIVDARGQRAPRVTLSAPHDSALRVAGRAYSGALVVSPHPQSGLRVHNEVALETYVAGVVAAELSLWSAPPAELEAQAIAARTFALGQLRHRARDGAAPELVDGVMDQAYLGLYQPTNAATLAIAERLDAAVRATHGVVLMRGARLEEARFHASCGGRTAAFSDIFPEPDPGPPGSDCPPCIARAEREARAGQPDPERPLGWSVTVTQEALARAGAALGLGGPIVALGPKRLDTSGRWLDAQLRGPKGLVVVPFDALRRALGYGAVKSARIVRAVPPFGATLRAGITLQGLGRGHGVGLCQEGARDLARDGWSAEQILALYYPGARLVRLDAGRAALASGPR